MEESLTPVRKTLKWAWVIEVSLLLAPWLSRSFETFIKSYSNLFMAGRSSFKVYLFLIILIVLRRFDIRKFKPQPHALRNYTAALTAVFALGLGEYLYFYYRVFGWFKLGLFKMFDAGLLPNVVSGTSLRHTHNAKAVFGFLLKHFLQTASYEKIDAGLPFVDSLPVGLLVIHLSIYLYFIYATFRLLASMTTVLKPEFFVVFGLAVGVLAKNAIDGGVFNNEAWLFGLPLYVTIAYSRETRIGVSTTKVFLKYAALWSGMLAIQYVIFVDIASYGDILMMHAGAGALAFLLVLLKPYEDGRSFIRDTFVERRRYYLAVFALLAAVVSLPWGDALLGAKQKYALTRDRILPESSEIALYLPPTAKVERFVASERFGRGPETRVGRYRYVRLKLHQPTSYYALAAGVDVDPNFSPVASCEPNDDTYVAPSVMRFQCFVPTRIPIRSFDSAGFSIEERPMEPLIKDIYGELHTFREFLVKTPACTPMVKEAQMNLLAQAGLRKTYCFVWPLTADQFGDLKRAQKPLNFNNMSK